jgi:hypothetical protein
VFFRRWTQVRLTALARLLAKEATMTKPWRCRLGIHRWQRLRNPEGGWYRECRRCQKQQGLEDTPMVFPSS